MTNDDGRKPEGPYSQLRAGLAYAFFPAGPWLTRHNNAQKMPTISAKLEQWQRSLGSSTGCVLHHAGGRMEIVVGAIALVFVLWWLVLLRHKFLCCERVGIAL
jgi:hypothetical protein